MLFNSLNFLIFLPVVWILHWMIGRNRVSIQNGILLVASYFFYANWDWRFLFLLLFSTLLDYFSGIKIEESQTKTQKKTWLFLSVILNLGFLGFFKYYNFFVDSFAKLLDNVGLGSSFYMLNIILPVGISFYTFHGLSYIFDIYFNRIKAERSFVTYSLFVSFFPLLVAGPIERATHLLPQLRHNRIFDYESATDGLKQILWGFFKKVVIADTCAFFVNTYFDNPTQSSGSTLLICAVLFSFQIYGDFSGYSDIALGTAKLFGIQLLKNFSYPYFSRNIAEFWRRWHISLSSWFRDYVYFPLGGSRGGMKNAIRNTFIIFIVSGFWHGANWTFIFWGVLNALFYIPVFVSGKHRQYLHIVAESRSLPTLKELLQLLATFSLVTLAWIVFRSNSLNMAFEIYKKIFSASLFQSIDIQQKGKLFSLALLMPIFIGLEWIGRRDNFAIERTLQQQTGFVRWTLYALILSLIGIFMETSGSPFIYFQF